MYEGKNIVGIYNEYHENPNNGVPLLPYATDEFLALENALLTIEKIDLKRITESQIDELFI
jgi:hypothetical protein